MHELKYSDPNNELSTIGGRRRASVACIFCGEATVGENNNREKHIGRHMEEIAFAVVRKPVDQWEFYSDSSRVSPPESDSVSTNPVLSSGWS